MTPRWPTAGLSALLAALAVVVAGCGSPELDALKNDPVAELTFADVPLLERSEREASEGLKGPIPALLRSRFDLTDVDNPQRVFDEAVAAAQEHGWAESAVPGLISRRSGSVWWEGSKTLGGYQAVIKLALHESPFGESADLVLDVRREVME